MFKIILAGSVAMLIAGTTLAQAQYRPDGYRPDGYRPDGYRPAGARRWQPSVEDMRAFGDARIAGLKAGLALSAEQEKNWSAFEQAARDFQKLRIDRLTAGINARRGGEPRTTNPAERMERQASAMAETSTALKKLADATGPLYGSLDDNQKRRFGILSRMGAAMGGDGYRGGGQPMMRDGFGPRFRRTDDGDIENGPGAPARTLMQRVRGEEEL